MSNSPSVLELHIADAKDRPMVAVDSVSAVAGRGLLGDRYYTGTGYYSDIAGWGAQVTLIQSEAIQAVNTGYDTDFAGSMLRRNIVTQNIKLDSLIGKTFRCGHAILRGTKPFPPCAHLAYLLGRKEVLKCFAYCGGIGADVVGGGDISVGDSISIIEPEDGG
ncbi:MOSC domain protein [Rubripirellula tenax]|uniref:MOSC domain protein n=1 Tax=Rubripirellula tenax TaxID=2528015 RepID=A0A5C6EMX0_9BACT|nr:MOSC domain-containing protein [Rubripirellula tenax]TWU48991.1 MOSC domain protein [Rubripirellula tenax]